MPPTPKTQLATVTATATATRVTRSSSRNNGIRAMTTAATEVNDTAVAATKDSEYEAAAPPPKRRKASHKAKSKATAAAAVAVPPTIPHTPPPPVDLSHATQHLVAVDARFGPLMARIPCKPFCHPVPTNTTNDSTHHTLPKIDPFRTLVTSIIGQQVSWMAARSITRRFVAHFCGDQEPEVKERENEGLFPTREQVSVAAVVDLKGVGCSTRKAEYLIELAQHFISGKLSDDLLLNGSDDDVARALIAVRGIGRWTVDMFLIFTLRRPDVLPVGDLGVQKGLLRWVLAAHGALPPSVPKTPKKGKKDHEPSDYGASEQPETVKTPPPKSEGYVLVTPQKLPPGALHPNGTTLATPVLSSTPAAPAATPNPKTDSKLPPAAPDSILHTPHGWDSAAAHRAAPLPEGLSLSALKARLAGKKAKGGVYLLPEEMEVLTTAWKPYRSVGTYYTWSMAGETP